MNVWSVNSSAAGVAIIASEDGSHLSHLFDGSRAKTGCVPHKPESLNWRWDTHCFQAGPASNVFFHCHIFITRKKKKKSQDIYAIHGIENEERGRETERVHIACGGHYFWCAPRLGELENIILSGWFDSAMKNVRSGDDKSWCWGEETGRQGMSFVMSAIWLHPSPPPPSHLPPQPHLTLSCVSSSSSFTSVVSVSLVFFFYLDTIFHLFSPTSDA